MMRNLTNKLSRWVVACSVIAGGLALAGCNTTEGAGKDIKKAGEQIEDSAK